MGLKTLTNGPVKRMKHDQGGRGASISFTIRIATPRNVSVPYVNTYNFAKS